MDCFCSVWQWASSPNALVWRDLHPWRVPFAEASRLSTWSAKVTAFSASGKTSAGNWETCQVLFSLLQCWEYLSMPVTPEGQRAEYCVVFAGPEPAVSTNKITKGCKHRQKREREESRGVDYGPSTWTWQLEWSTRKDYLVKSELFSASEFVKV